MTQDDPVQTALQGYMFTGQDPDPRKTPEWVYPEITGIVNESIIALTVFSCLWYTPLSAT